MLIPLVLEVTTGSILGICWADTEIEISMNPKRKISVLDDFIDGFSESKDKIQYFHFFSSI